MHRALPRLAGMIEHAGADLKMAAPAFTFWGMRTAIIGSLPTIPANLMKG